MRFDLIETSVAFVVFGTISFFINTLMESLITGENRCVRALSWPELVENVITEITRRQFRQIVWKQISSFLMKGIGIVKEYLKAF